MLNSRQLYWLKIKASLHTLFYIMLVTTSCEVLASEISITRIGPTLKHPWGLTTVGGQSVLVTTRSGSLYLINTSTQISKKIFNTPNVVEYRQGGLLDVTSQKIGDEIVVFLCYSKPVSSSESSTAVFRATLDGDRLLNGSDIFVSNKPSRSGVHFGCRL
ncbi:MAG: PQQ-dependent sugar dehydrogenase, partial [Pseudomonadota bacterium]|nr:PQQ-dependent sugar dehydrogenase [Pseudomonadota bacterium]